MFYEIDCGITSSALDDFRALHGLHVEAHEFLTDRGDRGEAPQAADPGHCSRFRMSMMRSISVSIAGNSTSSENLCMERGVCSAMNFSLRR